MDPLPPSPPPAPAPAAPASATAASAPAPLTLAERRLRRQRRVAWTVAGVALIAALVALGLDVRREFARQDERLLAVSKELAAALEQAAVADRQAQARIDALERDVESLREQRSALDQLYLDLTRGRDDAILIDVERLVTLAAQELQVSGNAATALAALTAADSRLARLERPQFVGLRRALTRDIDRLRAVPAVDVIGLGLRLDQLAQGADSWPLLAEPSTVLAPPGAAAAATGGADTAPASWGTRLRGWLAQEFGDLVRIREVEAPDALLLAPRQQQLVRVQFKLRLLTARQALLTRSDKLFRADLAEAQVLLARYFDTRQPAVAAAQAQLKQLAAATVSVDVPQINDSVSAVRALRPAGR
jgi:uncharacterized protein HemX